jgi:hypothetical protein
MDVLKLEKAIARTLDKKKKKKITVIKFVYQFRSVGSPYITQLNFLRGYVSAQPDRYKTA